MASTWLTTLPLEEGYSLTKQLFCDLIRIRYGWELSRIPETCECSAKFNLQHALSCKKGGFISIRHNNIRNVTATLLKEVCKDVRIEPSLQPLTGEDFQEATAKLTDEARCDISARGFWSAGQVTFLDIRVFNPNANRYANQNLSKAYESNEKEKKRHITKEYWKSNTEVLHQLVMSATGGMARESKNFYARLSEMVSEKRNQPYPIAAAWIKRKISFSLIRSVGLCLKVSRSVNSSMLVDYMESDATSSEVICRINNPV